MPATAVARRLRRGRRLHTVVSLAGLLQPPDVHLEALSAGLAAAALLRLHFPLIFFCTAGHVAATVEHLAAVTELFLALAYQHLLRYDTVEVDLHTVPFDITATASARPESTDDLAAYLAEEFAYGIWFPRPEVYGVGSDVRNHIEYEDPLTLALWWLLDDTAWSMSDEQALADSMSELPPTLYMRLLALPRLPAAVDMEALAARLDTQCSGVEAPLGALLRFAVGMTGNDYADRSHEEVLDGEQYASWTVSPQQMMAERHEQDAALAMADRYYRLQDRAREDPSLLAQLAEQIVAAAARHVAASPACAVSDAGGLFFVRQHALFEEVCSDVFQFPTSFDIWNALAEAPSTTA